MLIDIYNNGNGHAFAFDFEKAGGNQVKINPTVIDAAEGWQTVSFKIPAVGNDADYPLRLTRYVLYTVTTGAQSGETYSSTVLLDNLRIHGGTVTSVANNNKPIPAGLTLEQNYPNPFNPATIIQYSIPVVAALSPVEGPIQNSADIQQVTLKVYDILGREIATLINGYQKPGFYKVYFNASALSSGIYFYKLSTGGNIITKKMLVLK